MKTHCSEDYPCELCGEYSESIPFTKEVSEDVCEECWEASKHPWVKMVKGEISEQEWYKFSHIPY